nr:transposase [Flavobacterium frigoritolerans]
MTLATYNRENIFDSIDSDLMILNDNGKIIESIKIRDNWIFHNWIIMPNHIHLLIEIQNNDIQTADIQSTDTQYVNAQTVETYRSASTFSTSNNTETNIAKTHCATQKTLVSRTSIRQSNYHDHIVRNYNSFEKNRFLYNQ